MAKPAAGGDAGKTEDSTTKDDVTDSGKAGGDVVDDKGADAGGKTFTQADIDAAVASDRLDRRRAATAKATSTKKKEAVEESDEAAEFRKRAETAEANLRLRDARDAVEKAAKDAGFINPAKIYRLLKDDLSFDDAGKPENVKDLITVAKRDFPEEIAAKVQGSADGGAKGAAGAKSSMNDFIRKATGRS